MTSQFDFTNAEWSDIASLPVLVGYAIAEVEDSGRLGSRLEIRALVNSIAEKAPTNAAQSLIEAASLVDVQEIIERFEDHAPDVVVDVAVAACQQVSRLLTGRADADEADAYQRWVFDIAHQVANAASEDGMRVSPAESKLLDRIKAALAI